MAHCDLPVTGAGGFVGRRRVRGPRAEGLPVVRDVRGVDDASTPVATR